MKIGLLDVDGHNWPNLAQMKLSAWHKSRGDKVERFIGLGRYDLVYQSKVFTDEYAPDYPYEIMADKIVKGGTGYGLHDKLPDEVEHCYPDYGLYGIADTAYGYLTRGCPRACRFCIVSEKEGKTSRHVADLGEFWRGQRYIKLLDPNLLACPDHLTLLSQLVDSGAWVDFTQGLDIRLITEENAELIRRVKVKNIHFAWDNPAQDLTEHFRRFKEISGIDYRKLGVYVLTNFNSTHQEDLHRIYTLRDLGYSPYVMIYDKANAPRHTRLLQRWVNNRIIFKAVPWFEGYDARRG